MLIPGSGSPGFPEEPRASGAYDRITIGFHWLTATLVVVLFGTTVWWNNAPKPIRYRFELKDFHVSLGLVFAAVIVGRLLWRAAAGRRLPPATSGLQQRLAGLIHALLYAMLCAQVALGVLLRSLQTEDGLPFFGLFTVPALVAKNKDAAELVETLHNYTGWAIVVVAAGHAAVALLHHYVFRDGVLRRMLPAAR